MTLGRFQVTTGMDVVGADGDRVGSVKAVRDTDFLVDRSMRRDVYVPFDAVRDVSGNVVTLNVTADQVDNMGWQSPPISAAGATTAPEVGGPYRCPECGAEFATREELQEHALRAHGRT